MNSLPNEIICQIISHLDPFHLLQFACSSSRFYNLINTKTLNLYIDNYYEKHHSVMSIIHNIIRRINYDGVVYGECEICRKLTLLYNQNDERCICLERCYF